MATRQVHWDGQPPAPRWRTASKRGKWSGSMSPPRIELCNSLYIFEWIFRKLMHIHEGSPKADATEMHRGYRKNMHHIAWTGSWRSVLGCAVSIVGKTDQKRKCCPNPLARPGRPEPGVLISVKVFLRFYFGMTRASRSQWNVVKQLPPNPRRFSYLLGNKCGPVLLALPTPGASLQFFRIY